jgi:hypothetical protein
MVSVRHPKTVRASSREKENAETTHVPTDRPPMGAAPCKGIVHCPRCEESASLFGGRFARHQIDALLATLQVRPDANECSGHEREEHAPDCEVVAL